MGDSEIKRLNIEPCFKDLIRPLLAEEYRQLEENILREGCREAIIVWGDTIIDGHNRYEICTRHQIPFETKSISFASRDEAIIWICNNQLGRRNISEETRKYLIGKRYEYEKNIGARNITGRNQYLADGKPSGEIQPQADDIISPPSAKRTAERIAEDYHISHGTVEKYALYSKAIDEIQKKEPSLVPKILSGSVKISHENVVDLSRLPQSEVTKFKRRVDMGRNSYMNYCRTRRVIPQRPAPVQIEEPLPEIKNMPVYNADSEVEGIILTIPSWTNSIVRTQGKADFKQISEKSKTKLKDALMELSVTIEDFLEIMSDDESEP